MTTPLELRQFYSLDGVNLPLRYPVRVIWNGRGPFKAARVKHPQTRALCWVTYENGAEVYLPCKRRRRDNDDSPHWKGWHTLKGDNPTHWAPLEPAKFKLFRLPPVAFILPDDDEAKTPRMWHEKASFNAALAAEEMEADRDAARRSNGIRKKGKKRTLWWLVGSAVRYSPPGKITRDEAEGRIMRALAQEDLESKIEGLGLHRRQHLTFDEMRELAEWEAKQIPSIQLRYTALQDDVDDYDVAMSWFTALGTRDLHVGQASAASAWRRGTDYSTAQWVLLYASRDSAKSFSSIAKDLRFIQGRKISAERVRQVYVAALESIWIIANEFQDIGRANRAAALDQLKEGNRRARGQR